jgi:hypothetical protein
MLRVVPPNLALSVVTCLGTILYGNPWWMHRILSPMVLLFLSASGMCSFEAFQP